ncbi:hypothetical protein [Helicobacter typhlonius]|uniref:hypothetical protein n=1 Tax=Helicobacter typhlonius TaxID=76936 RepID=UPI002FE042DB
MKNQPIKCSNFSFGVCFIKAQHLGSNAKKFSDDSVRKMINAVLDKLINQE